MQRIDTSNRSEDLFGVDKHGFKDGNPLTGDPATALNADWFNALQEEVAHVIEHAGLALDPASLTQLREAIQALVPGSVPAASTTVQGKVELATIAEVRAGTDATRAATPSTLDPVRGSFRKSRFLDPALVGNTLDPSYIGQYCYATDTSGSNTNMLPTSDAWDGAATTIHNVRGSSGNYVVHASVGDVFSVHGGSVNSLTIAPGDVATFVRIDDGLWYVYGTAVLGQTGNIGSFAHALDPSGYQKLPSGLFLQWGTAQPSTAGVVVTFPVAFPTGPLICIPGAVASVANATLSVLNVTTTGFTFYSSGDGNNHFWFALGY